MDPHSGESDREESRVTKLYDELESLVRAMPPDRRQALMESDYDDDETTTKNGINIRPITKRD